MKNRHRGSSFNEFLKEEGLFEECTAEAIKRVIAFEHNSVCVMAKEDCLITEPVFEEVYCNYSLAMSNTE